MDIAWVRDLVIIIFAVLATAVLIMAAIFVYQRYRDSKGLMNKANSILEASKNVAKSIESILARISAN